MVTEEAPHEFKDSTCSAESEEFRGPAQQRGCQVGSGQPNDNRADSFSAEEAKKLRELLRVFSQTHEGLRDWNGLDLQRHISPTVR
jgi:hypothetical protein